MSSTLKSSGGALLGATLVVTLAAVMLALFPAVAGAQTEDKSASSVVVRPGDSLWSISEERLGPNATPRKILNGVERIYALNRARIGADPDLVFVGQELLVPPAMSERHTGAPPAPRNAGKTTGAAEAPEADPRDETDKDTTDKDTTDKAPRTAPGGADAQGDEASAPVADREVEPVGLPNEPAAAPVPAVRAVASNGSPPTPVASFLRMLRAEVASVASAVAATLSDGRTDGGRMFGLGVLALTLAAAALMAWKLPMRRTIRQDDERWGPLEGYYGETPRASRITPFDYHPGAPEEGNGRDTREREPQAPETLSETIGSMPEKYNLWLKTGEEASLDNHVAPNGGVSMVSMIRNAAVSRGRARTTTKSGAVARNGLALSAHNPKVRSVRLRAHASMRARKLRPRRGHRGARSPSGKQKR